MCALFIVNSNIRLQGEKYKFCCVHDLSLNVVCYSSINIRRRICRANGNCLFTVTSHLRFLLPSTLKLQQCIILPAQLYYSTVCFGTAGGESHEGSLSSLQHRGWIYVLSFVSCCLCLCFPQSLHAYKLPDLP